MLLLSVLKRYSWLLILQDRGVATNNGLGGGGDSNWDHFCIVSMNVIQMGLMFLRPVNNIEHNIKQNVYTSMKVIPLIPP